MKPDRGSPGRCQERARFGIAVTEALRGIKQFKVAAPQSNRARALTRLGSEVPTRSLRSPVMVGASRRRAAPRSQFVVALLSEGLRLRSSPCRQRRATPPLRLNRRAACKRCTARPNWSFKGTRNSKAARPRSAQAYHTPHGRASLLLRAP